MRVNLKLDLATTAFAADQTGEMAALMERVGELIAEFQQDKEKLPINADLFDSDCGRIGTLAIWEA